MKTTTGGSSKLELVEKSGAGQSISTNTILRNSGAYDLYRNARGPEKYSVIKDSEFRKLMSGLHEDERHKVMAKVVRLRRRSKEALIAIIISLERTRDQQAITETTLRDELVQLSLKRFTT